MVKQRVNVIGMSTSETLALSGVSKISKQQFLNYIAKVDNIEQLQYVFNKSKLSFDEAKNGMKEFLVSNSDDMFKSLNQGGLGKEKMKQLLNLVILSLIILQNLKIS